MRYLKIYSNDLCYGKESITKEDLIDARDKDLLIVDTVENKYFDPESNQWKEVFTTPA